MTDNASHLGATLQEFLDGRLDGPRQAEVRAHLAVCPQCHGELEALRWVRNVALKQLPGAAAVALLLFLPSRGHVVNDVARDYAQYSAGRLELSLRSSDGAAVESLFVRGGIAFRTRVFDLGMMEYRLVGGRVHRLRGRPSALSVYRGPGGSDLVCQMFPGRLAELPRTADVREHDGIAFQVYRVEGVTLVFWQEGAVVCVLASDADSEAVIQLAYAKAVKV